MHFLFSKRMKKWLARGRGGSRLAAKKIAERSQDYLIFRPCRRFLLPAWKYQRPFIVFNFQLYFKTSISIFLSLFFIFNQNENKKSPKQVSSKFSNLMISKKQKISLVPNVFLVFFFFTASLILVVIQLREKQIHYLMCRSIKTTISIYKLLFNCVVRKISILCVHKNITAFKRWNFVSISSSTKYIYIYTEKKKIKRRIILIIIKNTTNIDNI